MIPYGRQQISDADVDAVVQTLRSDFLTQGPAVPAFEKGIADFVGAPFAVAVNSATSALHIAYLALDLGPGDLLWTSPNTFVATANAALLCGAHVDFVDIDPISLNLSTEALAEKLKQAERAGRLPKVVVPVHFAGEPCDMAAIAALARQYGFKVVEDASHAIGSRYGTAHVGACDQADLCVFSFHPVKIITTCEGGLVTTRDATLAARLRRLRSHGITREADEMEGVPDGPWSYQQIELGLNYRLTDVQAALGTSQLRRVESFIAARHALADVYDKEFDGMNVRHSVRGPGRFSALHLYVIRWPDRSRLDRRAAFERLRTAGIGVNVHYSPVHRQPYYRRLGFSPELCPNSLDYYRQAITLPLHPGLEPSQQRHIVSTIGHLIAGS